MSTLGMLRENGTFDKFDVTIVIDSSLMCGLDRLTLCSDILALVGLMESSNGELLVEVETGNTRRWMSKYELV